MAQRPTFIHLPSGDASPARASPSSSALPSPRMPRMAGEIAPAMSPLDMFAAQSRALARQLEEEKKSNRRVSRLPPLAVQDGFARFGGHNQSPHSAGSSSVPSKDSPQTEGHLGSPEEPSGNKVDIEEPAFRPKSYYPRFSKVAATPESDTPRQPSVLEEETFATPGEYPTQPGGDYFGGPRTRSPEPAAYERPSLEMSQHGSQASFSRPKQSFDSMSSSHMGAPLHRGMSQESTSSRISQYSTSLQPPNPYYARKAPSIRSVSSEDDNPGITPSSSTMSQARKLSSSSGVSLPLSPQFPYSMAHNRSTSQLSEHSIGGSRLSRPTFNFSRPLSRNSPRPSMDYASRTTSTDSHPHIYGDDEISTPISVNDNVMSGDPRLLRGEEPLANSYIYAKYSLPRGRMVDRDSIPLDRMMPHFEWEQPKTQSNVQPIRPVPADSNVPAALPTPPHSIESEAAPRGSTESLPARPPPIPASKETSHRHSLTSMNTQNSGSTIKARKRSDSQEMTAEDHLNKGIECHEKGSLNESTYHFRLAARQNNPTAMLMYALACRHGWGMRPNQKEGVTWLRKAMDCASIEMTLDEDGKRPGDLQGQKTRQAQFALSVYELGVSHMNGWGIEQDKFLALRCFEIASSWGDADAMAEAGFCFAQGVGCKKDLKRAAKYYRDAEAKGMSMVGNSWIYKSKYDPKPEEDARTGRSSRADGGDKKDKKRDKSRTRSIFGRKKTEKA